MIRPPTASSYVTLALGEEVLALEVGIVREILDSTMTPMSEFTPLNPLATKNM